jgi:aldehyde dehydrogenase (NAD+)
LNNLADLFEKNRLLLASVEALDNGKAVSEAQGDVQAAANVFRYYGGWADKVHGKVIDTAPGKFNYTKQEPVGVCGQIIPYVFLPCYQI